MIPKSPGKPSYLAGYESPLSCQSAQFMMGMAQYNSIFTSCYVPFDEEKLDYDEEYIVTTHYKLQ